MNSLSPAVLERHGTATGRLWSLGLVSTEEQTGDAGQAETRQDKRSVCAVSTCARVSPPATTPKRYHA